MEHLWNVSADLLDVEIIHEAVAVQETKKVVPMESKEWSLAFSCDAGDSQSSSENARSWEYQTAAGQSRNPKIKHLPSDKLAIYIWKITML